MCRACRLWSSRGPVHYSAHAHQDSELEEFFYPDLKPYEHYIPIKRDFSDLETQAPPSLLLLSLWVVAAAAAAAAAEVVVMAAAAVAVWLLLVAGHVDVTVRIAGCVGERAWEGGGPDRQQRERVCGALPRPRGAALLLPCAARALSQALPPAAPADARLA